jgi:hypothetical protein
MAIDESVLDIDGVRYFRCQHPKVQIAAMARWFRQAPGARVVVVGDADQHPIAVYLSFVALGGVTYRWQVGTERLKLYQNGIFVEAWTLPAWVERLNRALRAYKSGTVLTGEQVAVLLEGVC